MLMLTSEAGETLPEATARRALPAWLVAALVLVGVLAIALPAWLVLTTPRVKPPAKVVLPTRVVPKTELPPVEPVQLQAVDPEDARAINAAIPFSTDPNPAARAFNIFGAEESRARAVDCLAAGVYYEAGDDAVGQRAVAQVILNRVRHPAYPKTVCGVVFQGQERRTGCQFTFTCDGSMLRYTPTEAAWRRAREVARMALTGSVYKPVGHATHYHTDWVVPYWSASLEKITEVHTHLFFRWAGWWGTPGAFNRGYAGVEPNVPQLARLSATHIAGPGQELAALGATDATVDPSTIPAGAIPTPIPGEENSFLVTLPAGKGPEMFAALAIRTCGERPYCKFMGWTDASKTPTRLPLSSTQVAAMSFSYLRDEAQGFAKALWNCDQFRRPSPVQCMRAQPLAGPAPAPVPLPGAAKAGAVSNPVEGPAPLTGVRRRNDPAAAAKAPVSFTLPAPKAAPSPAASPSTAP